MITSDQVGHIKLLAALDERHRAEIAAHAADIHLQAGEWLIHEGELPAFFGLLSGKLELLKELGSGEHVIGHHVTGDSFGELPLLLGSPALASLRAVKASRLLRLDPADFHRLVAERPELSSHLLRTMAHRIHHLQELSIQTPVAQVTVIGHRWDLDCYNLRDFLTRHLVAFTWADPDSPTLDPEDALSDERTEALPTVVLQDGTRLNRPSLRELAGALGLQISPSATLYDVAIIGAGPAGLGAAVYGASEGLHTIVIDREAPGGQAGTSSRIENYLGFPAGLSGSELSSRALHQATRFGAEILVTREVTAIEPGRTEQVLLLDGGDKLRCRALVLASGVAWQRLNVPGAEKLMGRGVYYGAARTEALATRGKAVFIIGGGNSAGQAAMFFSSYAQEVTLLVRGEALAQSMSSYLIEELSTRPNVQVQVGTQVVRVHGEERLEAISVRDQSDQSEQRRPADGLFIFIGADPETGWLPSAIARDSHGFVLTGHDAAGAGWPLQRDPYMLETSTPGIFAAGDVRHGSVKRVASGVGEGSMSIALIHQYLAGAPAIR